MSYKKVGEQTTRIYRKKTFAEEFKEAIGVILFIGFLLLILSS